MKKFFKKMWVMDSFKREGQGEILCRQKSKAKKFTSYFLKTYRDWGGTLGCIFLLTATFIEGAGGDFMQVKKVKQKNLLYIL